ncbi:MAG TPA: CHRD domain-containing protein [Casimicrobiaceae bacterium]|nr:CHRD domain-containing protein [Casimicrobiaceae bacterium]
MYLARQRALNSPRLIAAAVLLFAAYGGSAWSQQEVKVTLTGSQEIPPVTTSASATGVITVAADKSVRGSVTVSGISPTAAHIHEAPAGTNGPIIIPLVKTGDNVWSVPEGAKMTDAQFESYKAGNLYYNVHSATYKGGELRGQIKP